MVEVIEQLNIEEIRLACEIANRIEDAYVFVEVNTLEFVNTDSLVNQINKDMENLSSVKKMIANSILMKIQWSCGVEKASNKFNVHTKVGDIYPKISQIKYEAKIGLFKLIGISGHKIVNGEDVIFGTFTDLINKDNVFTIWFNPVTTYIINNN